jgi:hypothetical protein
MAFEFFKKKVIIETPGAASIISEDEAPAGADSVMRDGVNDKYDETNTEHLMAHRNRNNVLDNNQ